MYVIKIGYRDCLSENDPIRIPTGGLKVSWEDLPEIITKLSQHLVHGTLMIERV